MISSSIRRLMTPEERKLLWQRDAIYWSRFGRGRAIGYRRGILAGSWFARIRLKNGKFKQTRIGQADDELSPNGISVFSFPQALAAAEIWCTEFGDKAIDRYLKWEKTPQYPALPKSPPYTVAHAVVDYLEWYREYRQGFDRAYYIASAFIFPDLGHYPVKDLTSVILRQWQTKLSEMPPRVRSGSVKEQKYLLLPKNADYLRRRQNTANRNFSILRAALNRAFERGLVEDDTAWAKVRSFRGVSRRKVRFLEKDEIKSLIQSCPQDLAKLVCGAVLTGCRIGELQRMIVNDFSDEYHRMSVTDAKSKEVRNVSLSNEGIEFFKMMTKGRNKSAHIFVKSNGTAWRRGGYWKNFKIACAEAGIIPPIRFHDLRHTYASQAAMAGISLKIVSVQLGHTDMRTVEKYYARLGSAHIDEVIQDKLPNLLPENFRDKIQGS